MKLRDTPTPVSGFQSVPYRKIELASTEHINLIDIRLRDRIDHHTPFRDAVVHLY
jgi:tryptophan 2,3-dioxygenase